MTHEIRPLLSAEDLTACEDLQVEVWGYTEREVVPKNELLAAVRSGGSLLGAFEGGALVGFVYGMAGLDPLGPYLSSRLLAVRKGLRGHGLGEGLKRAQRLAALELGYERVRWTQDPLQAANAHLNLRKLGARAVKYVRDYYGKTTSPLHGGLPTDRLELVWEVGSRRVKQRLGEEPGVDPDSVRGRSEPFTALGTVERGPGPAAPAEPRDPPPGAALVLVSVPVAFTAMLESDRGLALAWRLATRDAFERCFARGLVATDLLSSRADSHAVYALTREAST